MAINTKGLGRGIQALFEGNDEKVPGQRGPLLEVAPGSIFPNPVQPRQVFSEERLEELAASIRAHGILQPLLVRPGNSEGTYQLIAGERRLRAAQKVGLPVVPVIVRELTDEDALIVTLLENLQREDLNPIEEARGLEALRTAMQTTVEGLAEALGQPRGTVSNSLRLLKLDPVTQRDVAEGRISSTHAKVLLGLPPGEAISELRKRIIETGMTTRETEAAVSFWNEHQYFPWQDNVPGIVATVKKRNIHAPDENLTKLAKDIGFTLNCRAAINGNQDKGKISIAYDSNEQLFDLLEKLGLTLNP